MRGNRDIFSEKRVYTSQEMGTAIRVQISDKSVCISHYAYTLGKIGTQLFSLRVSVNTKVGWAL